METVAGEIRRACKELSIQYEEIPEEKVNEIRARIAARFTIEGKIGSGPLWERLAPAASVRHREGWSLLAQGPFVKSVLFFDAQEERHGFSFLHRKDLVAVLAETFGFEFYLSDEECSFVVAFNHHDYLIGAGAATDWVENIPEKL